MGSLLAQIRDAKGGKGIVRLKKVDTEEGEKIKHNVSQNKPNDILSDLQQRLEQRRAHMKNDDSKKTHSIPLMKLFDNYSTEDSLEHLGCDDSFD